MVKAQIFTVVQPFKGEFKESDVKLEEELPPLQDGEFLAENLYLSVDPYNRGYGSTFSPGQVMIGGQVAKIIESKNPSFPVGKVLFGRLGWRTHTIVKPSEMNSVQLYLLPDFGDLPSSLGLGVLGMPGICALHGFLDICKPVEGETVVVSGAAGAVGSHVGQIAKIKKCRVIGIAGSAEKCRWLESIGFDYVIDYKVTKDIRSELLKAAPKGIDCYFDNVGGEISTMVMMLMNSGGRVSVCGCISALNDLEAARAAIVQPYIISNELTLQGFRFPRFANRWTEGINQNLQWVQSKQLKYRETITDGFENTPKALVGVMKGKNLGKAVVRVKAAHVENQSVDFHDARKNIKNLLNV